MGEHPCAHRFLPLDNYNLVLVLHLKGIVEQSVGLVCLDLLGDFGGEGGNLCEGEKGLGEAWKVKWIILTSSNFSGLG